MVVWMYGHKDHVELHYNTLRPTSCMSWFDWCHAQCVTVGEQRNNPTYQGLGVRAQSGGSWTSTERTASPVPPVWTHSFISSDKADSWVDELIWNVSLLSLHIISWEDVSRCFKFHHKAADRIKKAEAEAGTREREGLETWRCQWNNGNVGNEDKTWSMWLLNSIQIILHSKSD